MKIFSTTVLLLCCLFSFSSQTRKVLIIGIDGCRSDALQQANTPNMDAVLANSLYSFNAWHTGITFSGPSWSTIMTGVEWNKHLVTSNSFTNTDFVNYPPFSTRAKEIKPNLHCSIVAEWHPLVDDITNGSWDHIIKVPDGSTWPTVDSTVTELQNPDLDLLFTYFDKVDLTGHDFINGGFSPTKPTYIKAIQDVDSAVGIVLNALYARPTYANEDWLILFITDHGGITFLHGGNSLEERQIWWIATGSAVAHQQITKGDPGTYNCNMNNVFDTSCVNDTLMRLSPTHPDIAVTALHHLIYDSGINPETKPEWKLDGKSWLTVSSAIAENDFEKSISVYPNPASGEITMQLNNYNLNTETTLTDLAGRKMTEAKPTYFPDRVSLKLDVPNGMYLLNIKNGNEKAVKKIQVIN